MPASASAETLLVPYRTIRRLEAGADAPFPATLCRLESGTTALSVDLADLPEQWQGWSAQPDGHVLHPLDVVRRPDGHDVLLPVLSIRLADLLRRRRGEGRELLDGEAVTLAVSLLRGLAELRSGWPADRGEWWMTDAGFPTLVPGCGSDDAIDATIAALDDVADGRPAAPWRDAREAARHPRLPAPEAARIEDALFAWSQACAVDLLPARSSTRGVAAERWSGEEIVPAEPRTVWEQLARHVDSDVADMFSRATTGVWRRLRARPARAARGHVVGLAAGVAALVLAGGLLWPHDAASEASDPLAGAGATPTNSPGAASHAATAEPPTPEQVADDGVAPASAPADLATITSQLLTTRSGCSGTECAAEVMIDPAAEFAPGVIDLPEADRIVTLLDEFGGVAVLRVDAADGGSGAQLVVIELAADRWLLRDVHAAQQP